MNIKGNMNVKQLRYLIREELEAQAPADAPFGKFLWPKERKLDVDEPNTGLENDLLDLLSKHFDDDGAHATQRDVDLIKDVLESGFYSNIIKAPMQDHVYRGMTVSTEWMQMMGLTNTPPVKGVETSKRFLFQPTKGEFSSWSLSIDATRYFAKSYKGWAVIMRASVSANPKCFLNCSKLYELERFAELSNEKEVIGLGNIRVNGVAWLSCKGVQCPFAPSAKNVNSKEDINDLLKDF
jgi:hypothetical protein